MVKTDLHRLEQAARFSAMLVTEFGDDYWPLFERLERELKTEREKLERLREFQ